MLQGPEGVFRDIDAAVLKVGGELSRDSAFVEGVRRSNRAVLLRWALANVARPGEPVAPEMSPEAMALLSELVRRGLDDRALHAFRVGQNVAWRHWMAAAFTLTEDPAELRTLLDITSRSVANYVDTALAAVTAHIARQRDTLTRSVHAERLEAVKLLLRESPLDPAEAGARLGYRLDGTHTAAVLWSWEPRPEPGVLEQAVQLLATHVPGGRPLTVLADATTLWAWLPGRIRPDADGLENSFGRFPRLRVTLGATASGVEGFRESHFTAQATRRLLDHPDPPRRVADYDRVQAAVLATQDLRAARHLAERTLGSLAEHPELCRTLRAYLAEQSNAARAARNLYLHRNTVLTRLARAEELLPRPLNDNPLNLSLALEIHYWRGTRPADEPAG